jgi:hypothetical protein
MGQPKDSKLVATTAKIRQEWENWLKSPVRIDRRRKIIEIEQPPPKWLWRAILLERLTTTPGALRIIDRLVKAGCDHEELLVHLEIILRSAGVDRWKKLTGGFRPRQIKAAVQRMRKCAREADALNSGIAIKVLVSQHPEWVSFAMLPMMLRSFADLWSLLPKALSRVQPDGQQRLMEHVIKRTGKFRYEELASLIGIARGSEYDAVALRMWCSKQRLTRPRGKGATSQK